MKKYPTIFGSSKDSPTIFVTYHKPDEIFNLPNNYKLIQVGKNCNYTRDSNSFGIRKKNIDNNDPFFKLMDYYDDMNDNISKYNHLISEMSAMYWVWKNLTFKDDEYLGFCAYRRISIPQPDFMNYDININSYFMLEHANIDNLNIYLKHCLRQDYLENYKFLLKSFPKDKDNFILFEKELFKNNISREMFVMKWKCFNELMIELYEYIKFIVNNSNKIFATTHVLEYILCFLIWKLSKKYTVKSNVDYIKPTLDIATYRNGIY